MTTGAVPRVRRPNRAPVLLTGATGLAALLLFRLRDPHTGGSYGLCPFHALTGQACPLCGGLRATHDLTTLRFVDALSSNALAVGVVALGVGYYAYWAVHRLRGTRARTFLLGRRATVLLALGVVAFTVLRNVPYGSVLAP